MVHVFPGAVILNRMREFIPGGFAELEVLGAATFMSRASESAQDESCGSGPLGALVVSYHRQSAMDDLQSQPMFVTHKGWRYRFMVLPLPYPAPTGVPVGFVWLVRDGSNHPVRL